MPFDMEQLTQALSVCDVINMGSVNNASVYSLGVDMRKFRRLMYIVQSNVSPSYSLTGCLQSCNQANFASNVNNIASTNFTTNQTNGIVTVELMDANVEEYNYGDRYVRLALTGSGGNFTVIAIGLGGEAIAKPAKQNDLNTNYLNQRVVCQ